MRVTFFGAALEVTGSCYEVATSSQRLLVDCGMFQGSQKLERLNVIPQGLEASGVKAVVLTHAHLDHCGRLPLLVKAGFRGKIYATAGTADVARLILSDAARIQEDDVYRENKRRAREGRPLVKPLYTQADAARVFELFRAVAFDTPIEIGKDVTVTLVEAGHILGSSCAILDVEEDGRFKRLVFSGDIGPTNIPLMKDFAAIHNAEVVFLESTYGDRDHKPLKETVQEFEELIRRGTELGGKILIPTFAVGRAQQMLFHLSQLFRQKRLRPIPIYLDSPMAAAATELYMRHQDDIDEDSGIFSEGDLFAALPQLRTCVTPEESKALNNVAGPCIILAGAGMCNAGRILHHLRHNLNSVDTFVLIVGYQAKGSIGRRLIEGAPVVKIFGETVRVRATVRGLGGFSAHAGQSDLLNWLAPMAVTKPLVVLTHGESHPMNQLAFHIKERFGITALQPRIREVIQV